jgi:multiple sugar transport system ATP-binding protein
MADEVALEIDHVDKTYHRRGQPAVHAVKSLSMSVKRGEIVALLGSSGCGKTSTLRMIAGFEAVTKGSIRLAGRRVDNLAPARRNVAMAFEGYSLYPPLTVRDNVAFALKGSRMRPEERSAAIARITSLVEIDSILDRYPAAISGGQQQRASLARALVRQAELYLLDEPMGQLEPQLRAVLRGRLKNLLVERRMSSIFVTHDQTEANALADRIAVMEGGVLQQFASPQELKDSPANLFVATFIGEPPMNVFDAVISDNGRFRLAAAGGLTIDLEPVRLSPTLRQALGRRDRVQFAVRPHKIQLGTGSFRAQVISNQWLGDQTHVAATIGGKLMVAVAHQRVSARIGDDLPFNILAKDIHVFDSATGTALGHSLEPS